jgi:hypothetical protein
MDDKMTWPPYVTAFFGVGLLRRRFLSGLKKPDKKLLFRRSPT